MSPDAAAYQRQIARTPHLPGGAAVEYRVTNPAAGQTALFDGCAWWSAGRELLEAKHGYGDLLEAGERYGFRLKAEGALLKQARTQQATVGPVHPVEWHVSDPRALDFFRGVVGRGAIDSNFTVHLTPAW